MDFEKPFVGNKCIPMKLKKKKSPWRSDSMNVCVCRASFRTWSSPSCATQTAIRSCGRRIPTSTFAWSSVRVSNELRVLYGLVIANQATGKRKLFTVCLFLFFFYYIYDVFFFYCLCSDVFEDFISPTTAAQTLLFTACNKRKEVSAHKMPSGTTRPLTVRAHFHLCRSYCQHADVSNQHPAVRIASLLNSCWGGFSE